MFNIKGSTFEQLILNFVKLLSVYAYDLYVIAAAYSFNMTTLLRNKSVFETYGTARYAADVTFVQTSRPRGNMEKGKSHYRSKHKLYGYKTKVSVLPNVLAIGCSNHYVGCTADEDIFPQTILWHKSQLKKTSDERNVTDMSSEEDKFPRQWASSTDKSFQRAGEYRRATTLTKKTHGEDLSRHHVERNKKLHLIG